MATDLLPCYRHPDRTGGVRCQRCDRPICPACMNTASVGFHCPECAGAKSGRQEVYTGRAAFGGAKSLVLTPALVAVNVGMFLLSLTGGGRAGEISGRMLRDYALYGPSIRYDNEWYRIITAGFLHAGLLHIAFNMYALWVIGNMLEPALGRLRFGIIFLGGLIAGSLGALVLDPDRLAVGASGAIFALFAAVFIAQRAAGIDPWRSGIALTIGINLLITLAIPFISKGGHIGGLAGGAILAWLLVEAPRRTTNRQAPLIAAAVLVPVFFLAAVGAAYAFA
ncbi:MAG TPA: rhomboid family intramembrane serine protease [Acidimicrobiales bacterium]|nr:rhomboid family intramembrane serine protease [Acidimicrobiales bacterium]